MLAVVLVLAVVLLLAVVLVLAVVCVGLGRTSCDEPRPRRTGSSHSRTSVRRTAHQPRPVPSERGDLDVGRPISACHEPQTRTYLGVVSPISDGFSHPGVPRAQTSIRRNQERRTAPRTRTTSH